MKVSELIDRLNQCSDKEQPVFIWDPYIEDIRELDFVDLSISDRVDINLKGEDG